MPAKTVMKWEIKETWHQIKCEGLIMILSVAYDAFS